jgi:hypothetical protein
MIFKISLLRLSLKKCSVKPEQVTNVKYTVSKKVTGKPYDADWEYVFTGMTLEVHG